MVTFSWMKYLILLQLCLDVLDCSIMHQNADKTVCVSARERAREGGERGEGRSRESDEEK